MYLFHEKGNVCNNLKLIRHFRPNLAKTFVLGEMWEKDMKFQQKGNAHFQVYYTFLDLILLAEMLEKDPRFHPKGPILYVKLIRHF
jgi:hypothetical protein